MVDPAVADAPREHEELESHPGPRKYVSIAVILAVVTAIEVAIYYVRMADWMLITGLMVFAVVKFILVAAFFMHLRFDSKLFRRFFVTGLVVALVVFGVVLATFFGRGGPAPGVGG